ncbi:hypothetical protein ACHQM5_018531 [Ranunculus cassubicifolius]
MKSSEIYHRAAGNSRFTLRKLNKSGYNSIDLLFNFTFDREVTMANRCNSSSPAAILIFPIKYGSQHFSDQMFIPGTPKYRK